MQRSPILAMFTACLISLPAAAAPVHYDMVFDDLAWSGHFVIDDATQTLQNGDRYLYTLTSFEITNGVHLFDQTDTYGDQDALGAVADFYDFSLDEPAHSEAGRSSRRIRGSTTGRHPRSRRIRSPHLGKIS